MLYVNGLAVGVVELKRSTVSVGDGIRQLLSNQQPKFYAGFFSTLQSCTPPTTRRDCITWETRGTVACFRLTGRDGQLSIRAANQTLLSLWHA